VVDITGKTPGGGGALFCPAGGGGGGEGEVKKGRGVGGREVQIGVWR